MWDDHGFQRHNAIRHQKEGRYQDRFGQTYRLEAIAYRGGERYYRLHGRGSEDGNWLGEQKLEREFKKVS